MRRQARSQSGGNPGGDIHSDGCPAYQNNLGGPSRQNIGNNLGSGGTLVQGQSFVFDQKHPLGTMVNQFVSDMAGGVSNQYGRNRTV